MEKKLLIEDAFLGTGESMQAAIDSYIQQGYFISTDIMHPAVGRIVTVMRVKQEFQLAN